MGDRSNVTLSVLIEQKEAVEGIIGRYHATVEEWEKHVHYGYPEVNYGELDVLDALQAAGIAFESTWDPGNEFGAGTDSCRFTAEGKVIRKTLYDEELGMPIANLMAVIDDPKALRKLILEWAERVGVLPWDNQVEYGKIYRTLQLLDPSKGEPHV